MPTPPRRIWYLNKLLVAGALCGLAASSQALPVIVLVILSLSCPLLIAAGLWIDYRQPHNLDRPFHLSRRMMVELLALVAIYIGFLTFSMHVWNEARQQAIQRSKQRESEYEALEIVKARTGRAGDEWATWTIKTDDGFEVHVQRVPRKEHYVLLYSDDGTFEGFSVNAP